MASTITKHSFYTPQTSPFPPLAAEGGVGNDSTVEVQVSSEAMKSSDYPRQASSGGGEVNDKVHNDVVSNSSSCESRDSTTISSSGSSTNTDEGSSLSAEDNNVAITDTRATVLSSASINSFDETSTEEEEEEIEVRKEDGATELFLLIEGSKWKDVCDR